jgi:hypothetical protein
MTSRSRAAARVGTQSSDSGVRVASDSPDAQIRSLDPPEAGNRNESAQGYRRVVAVLNDKWRVIECRDGIQWILQSRDTRKANATGVWRGRSYCRTKEALSRVCASHAAEIDPSATAVLAALPDWIETRSGARSPKQGSGTKSSHERADQVEFDFQHAGFSPSRA